MGTEEVHDGVCRNFIFVLNRVAAVKAGQSDPSMFCVERDRRSDRRVAIDISILIHEAMIAAWATDLYRENAFIGSDIDTIEACPGFMGNLFYFLYADIRKVMSVHHDDRPKSTGTEAVYCFQCDLFVRSCFSWLDSQVTLKFRGDCFASANVAGCSQADGDQVFPSWFQAEGSIESHNAVEVNQRTSGLLGDHPQGLFREIAVLGLNFFEKRDETRLISLMVILDDFLYVLGIHDDLSSFHSLSKFFAVPDASLGFRIDAVGPSLTLTA
jgi:hypothetical protein